MQFEGSNDETDSQEVMLRSAVIAILAHDEIANSVLRDAERLANLTDEELLLREAQFKQWLSGKNVPLPEIAIDAGVPSGGYKPGRSLTE